MNRCTRGGISGFVKIKRIVNCKLTEESQNDHSKNTQFFTNYKMEVSKSLYFLWFTI